MELFDLYTEDRVRTGRTMVRGTKVPEGLYRLVVHVCIFDHEGRMLIQQRQPFKQGWSNLWAAARSPGIPAGPPRSGKCGRKSAWSWTCRISGPP